MADAKTKPTGEDVQAFLGTMTDETRRADCFRVLEMMKELSGQEPALWASSMVGFGTYHYRYESGREGESFVVGFSPRKQALTLYLMGDYPEREELISQLGKIKTGKGCLYINRLDQVNLPVLRQMISASLQYMREKYGTI